jgi:aspartyl-tRNA(Asn)/glutamyl-tRNA(Gln) amidotransferase subunit B
MKYIEISDVNMEEGSFRADINISVKKKSDKKLGTRTELKNINSFRFIFNAIEYEAQRQIEILEDGGFVKQETRLWNEKTHQTAFMRSKEEAADYRYFADPDLPLLIVDDEWVERLQELIPELPAVKKKRFCKEYGLCEKEAVILTEEKNLAQFFEETSKLCHLPKKVSNWILRDLLSYMKEHRVRFEDVKATPEMLSELIFELEKGVINSSAAQEVFVQMVQEGKYPSIIIEEKGFQQIGSHEELEAVARDIIDVNPTQSQQFRDGNERIMPFFVGQAMKATKGKGNPKILTEVFKRLLTS